jgi:hypothetical protein
MSILRIKCRRLRDEAGLAHVRQELAAVARARQDLPQSAELDEMEQCLEQVNEQLWDVEDRLRDCERLGDFGPDFVQWARSVYRLNDHRAELKKRISEAAGSSWSEQKQYGRQAVADCSDPPRP